MIKNITIVSCHSREGGNLDTCFRRYDTKSVSPNSIGFTIPCTARQMITIQEQLTLRMAFKSHRENSTTSLQGITLVTTVS
ncbi:hypothetical protein [Candidatus Tisiphia endosymbiont of Hybos culiciformis]|uniref:hypothetical protein n=1 Tax=Candidatus Tisiphia endosymbiont of Hybos culiciformis TaxID=3139331 RepID=UPI003CCAC42E